MSSGEKIRYAEAYDKANLMWHRICDIGDEHQGTMITGSMRRCEEMIGDIDILTTNGWKKVFDYLATTGDDRYDILSAGSKRIIFKDSEGMLYNIFFTEHDSWGTAMMYTTGPQRYNIRKRYLIKRMGYKLNQYGLYNKEGEKIAGPTETGIYEALGWEWCEPEDRE